MADDTVGSGGGATATIERSEEDTRDRDTDTQEETDRVEIGSGGGATATVSEEVSERTEEPEDTDKVEIGSEGGATATVSEEVSERTKRTREERIRQDMQEQFGTRGRGLPDDVPSDREITQQIEQQQQRQQRTQQFRQTEALGFQQQLKPEAGPESDVPKDSVALDAFTFARERSERKQEAAEEAGEIAETISERVEYVEEGGGGKREVVVTDEGFVPVENIENLEKLNLEDKTRKTVVEVGEGKYVTEEEFEKYPEKYQDAKQKEYQLEKISEQLIKEPQQVKEIRYAREAFPITPEEQASQEMKEFTTAERARAEASTLFSTKSPEYIGATLGDVTGLEGVFGDTKRAEVVESRVAEEITKGRTDPTKLEVFGTGAYQGLRSVPGRIAIAGATAGAATKAAAGITAFGPASKTATALKGAGVAGLSLRAGTKGAEAIKLYRSGEKAEAAGEVITTAAEIGTAIGASKGVQKRIQQARIKSPRGRGKVTEQIQKRYTPSELEKLQTQVQYSGDYPVKPSSSQGFLTRFVSGRGTGTKEVLAEPLAGEGKISYLRPKTKPQTRGEFLKSYLLGTDQPQQVTYGGDYPVGPSPSGRAFTLGQKGTVGGGSAGLVSKPTTGRSVTGRTGVTDIRTLAEESTGFVSPTAVTPGVQTAFPQTDTETVQTVKPKPTLKEISKPRSLQRTTPGEVTEEKVEPMTATTMLSTEQEEAVRQRQPQRPRKEQVTTPVPGVIQKPIPVQKLRPKQLAMQKQVMKPVQEPQTIQTQKMAAGGMAAFPAPEGKKPKIPTGLDTKSVDVGRRKDKPLADIIGASRVEFEFDKAITPTDAEKDPVTGVLKPTQEEELDAPGGGIDII